MGFVPVIIMGYCGEVVVALAIVALAVASVEDNRLSSAENGSLYSQSISSDSGISDQVRFPVIVFLDQRNPIEHYREEQDKSVESIPLTNIQKQEDQNQQPGNAIKVNRQKRHLKKGYYGGGGGGCNTCQQRQQPQMVIVRYVPKYNSGGGGCQTGGCGGGQRISPCGSGGCRYQSSPCGGGCGGGGGGGQAYASASATATAYGKK